MGRRNLQRDGTHVQVCTSPDGKTWQAADLGPGGNEPHGGPHPAVAVSPTGRVVAVWGSSVGCPAACSYILQASVRPPGGSWGAPVTLSTELDCGRRGADARHGRRRRRDRRLGRVLRRRQPLRRSPGRERELGPGPGRCRTYVQGDARNLSLAVSPNGSAIVAYATQHDAIWAVSGTIPGGFSAPVFVGAGDYGKNSAPKAAIDDAGQASLVWSESTRTQAATRSPGGTWSAPVVLAPPVLQLGGHRDRRRRERDRRVRVVLLLAPGRRQLGAGHALPAGSSGGLVVGRSRRHLRLRRQRRQRVHLRAGATSFGPGSGSRGSLADLKIVPGLAVMLAAGAVSAEAVS